MPAYKVETDVKQIKKTREKKRALDYSDEEENMNCAVNGVTLTFNTNESKKRKQDVNLKKQNRVKHVPEINLFETNLKNPISDIGYTERLKSLGGSCINKKAIYSWTATTTSNDLLQKDDILNKMENVFEFTKEVSKEALEIMNGPVPQDIKPLHDVLCFLNENLESYFEKCDNDGDYFIGSI